jgi:branched-chain amino acid transport system permease protein
MLFSLTRAFDGLAGGALYGLVGIAFMLSARFGTGWNVAIASYASWAAFAAIFFAIKASLPFLLTLPLGIAASTALAIAVEAALLPLRRGPEARMVVVFATVAVWLALDALGTLVVGAHGMTFPAETYPTMVFGDDTAMLRLITLFDMLALAGVTVAVHHMLTATQLGTAMRAHGFDPLAAALGGVHPLRMILIIAAITGAITGFAGVLAAASGSAVTVALGVGLLWKGVAAAFLGGGRVRRIAVAGLAIGLAEILGADTWPQFWPLIPWQGAGGMALLAILLLRPRGLLPTSDMLRT